MKKTKLKPILPSLREKKRYLVFDIISKNAVNDIEQVADAVWQAALQFLGRLGTAKAGLMVLNNKWNAKKQRGILKVSNKHVDAVKASLVFANKINNTETIFHTLGVSGILKKAEKRFM